MSSNFVVLSISVIGTSEHVHATQSPVCAILRAVSRGHAQSVPLDLGLHKDDMLTGTCVVRR